MPAVISKVPKPAMVTFWPAWEWDVSAGTLIATEAGAVVTDIHGGTPAFNSEARKLEGCLVAGPGVHADLLARI